MKSVASPRHRQSGSFIIEAIISLILFAVALIGLLALSAQGLNQVGQSKARNDASYIAGELFSNMWVSATVNVTDWTTRLQTAVPGATANVYFSSCTCALSASTPKTYTCSGTALTGAQSIVIPQAVTVCISWADRKDPDNPRLYQASTMVTRNN